MARYVVTRTIIETRVFEADSLTAAMRRLAGNLDFTDDKGLAAKLVDESRTVGDWAVETDLLAS